MHESDTDQIARLIQWHATPELQPSTRRRAADPQVECADRPARDADTGGAARGSDRAIA
jgi:hypothetical protein